MSGPSKSQRSGPRVKPRVRYCSNGHELTPVWWATRGRRTMRQLCACDGYVPMAGKS